MDTLGYETQVRFVCFMFYRMNEPNVESPAHDQIKHIYSTIHLSFIVHFCISYAQMLDGVPGTGTRSNGLSGLLLKINLDGIVLIRFHHLCLRVSSLALVLYIVIVLPIYKTSQCSSVGGDIASSICLEQNLTDYQRLTISNVPLDNGNTTMYNNVDEGIIGSFLPVHGGVVLRLYVVVFVSWIINWYTYVLLEKEWREILALRRVYFLEANHWKDRNIELEETLLREEREENEGFDFESTIHTKTRDPWVPHPEQRDTVPNIELYSVLVGGLPGLPTEAFLKEEVKAVFSRKQGIDWQLAVTTAFFDHCVPNQPGFSSSVAAVTILPAASEITDAWNHWYKAAAKMRRLRFIRKQITELQGKDADIESGYTVSDLKVDDTESVYYRSEKKRIRKTRSTVYTESDEKMRYYSEVLGTTDDPDVYKNLLHTLNLGPEQTAVYCREFAEGAANLAPYGWNERKVRHASLEELFEMEKGASIALHDARKALREAQKRIADHESGKKLCDDNELAELMVNATNTKQKNASNVNLDGVDEKNQDRFKGTTRNENESNEGKRNLSPSSQNYVHTKNVESSSQQLRDNQSYSNVGFSVNIASVDESRSQRHMLLRSLTQNLEIVDQNVDQSTNTGSQFSKKIGSTTQGLVIKGRQSLEKTISSANRTSISALDALGLEAGLFLEQKNLSRGHIQHMPRNSSTIKRSRSTEDISILHNDKTERIKSMTMQPGYRDARKKTPENVKCSDDIYILQELIETDNSSELKMLITSDKKERNEIERKRLGYEHAEPDCAVNGIEKRRGSTDKSIWEKIASENVRRIKLRKRLYDFALTSDGKRRSSVADTRMFSIDETNDSKNFSKFDGTSVRDLSENDLSSTAMDQSLQLAYAFEEKAGLRRRQQSNATMDRLNETINAKWSKVVQIMNETSSHVDDDVDSIENGSYSACVLSSLCESIMVILKHIFNRTYWCTRTTVGIADELASESTFAVVTFTSRQAAVAARYCLADSRGADRWNTVSEMPSPPLADAPVCSLSNFRGCVRPVTISINDKQKMLRHNLALAILGVIYIFYIIPLTEVQQLLSPEYLTIILPDLDVWLKNNFLKYIFSGFIPALVWTAFYAVCPPMFKAIANFGSNATSEAFAEGSAMRYFWWFMVVSAFSGTTLASAMIEAFGEELDIGSNVQNAIILSARTIPTTVSVTWLNWIIVRFTLVLPSQYLLQSHIFFLSWLRLNVCARAIQGGGSGGPIPYRIYVDSAVVMLCLFALAPASPLIAIAVFFYFVFCIPILRWVLLFLHKPKFDIGGLRFPFIFDMCVSGMCVGQGLLGTMLLIRKSFGPAFAAFLPLIPTIVYRWILLRRYLKAFIDVALLQTSLLDGWDTNEESFASKREEFRQFLVDCHKAAYVPVCISSDEGTSITSEPAVVIRLETDDDEDYDDMSTHGGDSGSVQSTNYSGKCSVSGRIGSSPDHQNVLYHPYQPSKQPGRMMRRASYNGIYSPRHKYYEASPSTIQKRNVPTKILNQHLPYIPSVI